MFMDALGLVANVQPVAGADTDVSPSSIDLGAATPKGEIGTGEEIGFGVAIDVAAVTGGGETYALEVIQSASEDLSAPDVLRSRPMLAADLAAGSRHFIGVPDPGPTKRYLGLQWVKTGAGAGLTYTAWLTTQSAFSLEPKIHPKGYAN